MIWEFDPTHSQVSFSIRLMLVSTMRGRFNTFRGRLYIDEQNPVNSWVDAEVDATSIDTHNKLRDAHLRSADFFAVEKYPTITFKSTNVEHVGGQDYKVTGNLTMHGMTKLITFDVEYRGQSMMMGVHPGLIAKAKINRKDFGLGRGAAVQIAVSETTTIEIDLETVQQSVKAQEVVATACQS